VQNKEIKFRVFIVAASLLLAHQACAMDMGNMMNPSKWTGGNNGGNNNMMNPSRWMGGNNNDRYDDYRGGPGYGYGGGPGGYGGGPGYGSGPGDGGAPAYSVPGTEPNEAEIKQLKERLRQLEGGAK